MTNGRRGFATPIIRRSDPLEQRKVELRRSAACQRKAAHARLGPSAGALLARNFQSNIDLAPAAPASGYAPIGNEMDVFPLLTALAAAGHPCALPVVTGAKTPLIFRQWEPGAPLTEAAFGVAVPAASSPEIVPAVVLVPMLAFDAKCRRIGYGAGYYDRTLAELRAGGPVLAIGIAYADQQVEEIPVDKFDQSLDMIVTERSILRPQD